MLIFVLDIKNRVLWKLRLYLERLLPRKILPTMRKKFKALIAGEKAISSTEVMHRYHKISSTTSISRSKAALIKNDILDNKAGEFSFQDPIYAYWLKTEYFAK